MIKTIVPILLILLTSSVAYPADVLLYPSHFDYQGAFRVPRDNAGTLGGTGDAWSFSKGGGIITFNPTNNSLFIEGHKVNNGKIAEITIPALVNSTNLESLNIASVLQPFADITEGNRSNLSESHGNLDSLSPLMGGVLDYNGTLIGSVFTFYGDGNSPNNAVRSHFISSKNLSATGDFGGMYKPNFAPSFVSGFMSLVPDNSSSGGTNWVSALGGPALTGNGDLSVLSRTSNGPAAFSFDPSSVSSNEPFQVTPLLYYPVDHNTLRNMDSTNGGNPYFTPTDKIAGMIMIPGTKSVLYFGWHGMNNYYYGNYTNDPAKIGTACNTPSDNEVCWYDPYGQGGKGPHQYPYIYQVWAYNADDLLAVKNGTKQPWEPLPYAIWSLPIPFSTSNTFAGAVAYNPSTQMLYVSIPGAEQVGCCETMPVIHGFHLNTSASLPSAISIGGQAILLNGTIVVSDGTSTKTISSGSRTITQSWALPTPKSVGTPYAVQIIQQPTNQTCEIVSGTGTTTYADVSNVLITCDGDGGSSPIPGLCGSSNGLSLPSAPVTGLCTAGTPSAVSGSGPWSWTCAGSGGGNTANCGATLLEVPPAGNASAVVACPVMAGFR